MKGTRKKEKKKGKMWRKKGQRMRRDRTVGEKQGRENLGEGKKEK